MIRTITYTTCMYGMLMCVMLMLSAGWRIIAAATLAFWFGVDSAPAAESTFPGCTGRHVFAAVDATTPYDNIDRLEIIDAFGRMSQTMEPGDRLHIVTVAESAKSSSLLFDGCVPGGAEMTWYEGIFQAMFTPEGQGEKADFFLKAGKAVAPVLNQRHETPATALAATIAAYAPVDDLWLFTDLLESAHVRTSALLAGDAVIDVPLPLMQGVTAHVAGVGRMHNAERSPLSDIEMEHLLATWRSWFAGAGMLMEMS